MGYGHVTCAYVCLYVCGPMSEHVYIHVYVHTNRYYMYTGHIHVVNRPCARVGCSYHIIYNMGRSIYIHGMHTRSMYCYIQCTYVA